MARYIATPEVPTGFANRCVYSTPGTYTFTVPSGVTQIKAIAVGGGSGGSTGFIKGATVSTQIICNNRNEVRATISGCCCYTPCITSCISGTGCSKFCLPELKTCYYAYAGSGGGYAEKTISVSPGDSFSVTVANEEETSSFGTEISASGAQQPTLICSDLFPCAKYCTGDLPYACLSGSVCQCQPTATACITAEFVACARSYCVQSYSGDNISAITHRPGTGTGGDKNYTGGCGQDISISSDEIEYGITCWNNSYYSNCCECAYLSNTCHCVQMEAVWVVNNNVSCVLPFCTSFWNCVGGFCDYSCFDSLPGNQVHPNLCSCLLKDFIRCFNTCNKTHAINTWYGNCELAHQSRCKPQINNIPCKFSSSGELRAEVEMSYSGASSGSPVGDGKPGACAQFIGVGPSNITSPVLHYCLTPDCYTTAFFRNCGCNHYCCDTSCCWGKNPWYAKPEETLPHFYNHMIDFTTDASSIDQSRADAAFPGCLALNDNVFSYLDYKVPCRCYYWQNGIEKGVPPSGCSGVGDKGAFMGPNQMWECNGNCFGGDTCDGWTKATGFNIEYCGMHHNPSVGCCGTWILRTPYHLKGTELGVDGTLNCTYDQCLRCCNASCIELAHCWCLGNPSGGTCSCYCLPCVAAGLNNTCFLKPCTTIEQWVCYTVPNPFQRVATLCALNCIPNMRNHFQATLTALTFLDSKRWHYYCNGSMYCECCSPCFKAHIFCADPGISCCHCCASSYTCGQWWCNTLGNSVCKGTATDIVLPGSAGGPASCGNIPCQVTGSYYTTGPGADPSGVDIPKFISTGGGASVMSQDTFNKIMHEYNGSTAAWYLRECWAFKCDKYAEGGTTCCCNCCIRPISNMDCSYCECTCTLGSHFGFGCANMCHACEKAAVVCYSFKLYACMMAELQRKQGMSFECVRNTAGSTSAPDCAIITAVINVGSASGLYINSVSNNFVGQKTCLSGGGSSVTKYYAPIQCIHDSAKVCACHAQSCGPCYAADIQQYSLSQACAGHFTACLDDSTEPACKFTVVPCQCASPCYYHFKAPNLFCGCIAPGLSVNSCYNAAAVVNACGFTATPMTYSTTSGGGSGSSPYVPEIYAGPKLNDEYLFSSSDCIIGGSPQICIQGSSTTIAPGYSQGGGKSGCMGLLCDQQIITNNAYNGAIFPRGTAGFGGGGTLCGNGGTGLVVVYWN
jgi:hypothetical protein